MSIPMQPPAPPVFKTGLLAGAITLAYMVEEVECRSPLPFHIIVFFIVECSLSAKETSFIPNFGLVSFYFTDESEPSLVSSYH